MIFLSINLSPTYKSILFTFYLFLFTLSFCFLSCEDNTGPGNKPRVTLTAEYVGVTEAEFLLQTRNTEPNTQYQLFRDDSLISDGILIYNDTTITDTLLLPAYNYIYNARLITDGKSVANSQPLDIATMDSTSHKFQWETFSFGGLGSSLLYDVAIINENDIWAVGEIYSDTVQTWLPYNAVHWDGQQWELKRIPFIGSCSAVDYPPIRAIWAFSENNILFTNGGAIAKYNGSSSYLDCGMNALLDGAITKIFASDPSNIYAVGGSGTIVRYGGQGWQKLESGTETVINDVWGFDRRGETLILATVSNEYHPGYDFLLLSISPFHVSDTLWNGMLRPLHSVWFNEYSPIYISGDGLHEYKRGKWHEIDIPPYFGNRVRGSGINNIFVAGAFGLVVHYNGWDWHHYPSLMMNGTLLGLAAIADLTVAVGERDNYAYIIVGRK